MEPIFNNEPEMEFQWVSGENLLADVKELFTEYEQSLDIDLDFQDFAAELQALPGKYALPEGALLLAFLDGQAAGCIALRKVSEDIAEMKRLYVRKPYRGYGLGRQLAQMIIDKAKSLGYSSIRLDTVPSMQAAQHLYSSLGFYDIEPYVYNPIDGARFMELRIKDQP
ncbi:MAG: GNAT family N-acetyltransferase [Syntrophomonadaceae bacterium]|jgi:ribosomal protein S18 acetylase RimI-like enzyme|nr:GNAT family N-acetyltransferase [Bacillota bacterium]NLP23876.1 GNAT family N-acetyltransferase [Syntrophomonadaceae bacterium]